MECINVALFSSFQLFKSLTHTACSASCLRRWCIAEVSKQLVSRNIITVPTSNQEDRTPLADMYHTYCHIVHLGLSPEGRVGRDKTRGYQRDTTHSTSGAILYYSTTASEKAIFRMEHPNLYKILQFHTESWRQIKCILAILTALYVSWKPHYTWVVFGMYHKDL